MVGPSENDRLVWIDCEMTGLDLAVDELVEIAIVVTDFELNVLDPGFEIVIKPDDSALANMGEFVTEMHRSSGLLDEIPHAYKPIDRVMADAADLVRIRHTLRQVVNVKGD